MRTLTLISALCLSLACAKTVNAQTCSASIVSSNVPGTLISLKNGTVNEIVNGLMWERCSLGQTYDANTDSCSGTPTIFNTWEEALAAADENNSFGAYDDWRLPNLKELAVIVERQCIAPAIDVEVFPNTPNGVYWSNSYDDQQIQSVELKGRLIDYTDGTEFLKDINKHRYIRLVRDMTTF